ncbi:MAG: hypothetical protein JW804_00285 [Sedimentisphaerales bacterium]|nr:hypothetical protein [Sedimentisphaerales bacterium]
MNTEQDRQKELVNATDCLEAINVFKFWKNILFVLIIICLLILQACFWSFNLDLVGQEQTEQAAVTKKAMENPPELTEETKEVINQSEEKIEEAAKKVTADAEKPAAATVNEPIAAEQSRKKSINLAAIVKKVHVMWTIKTTDFLIILLGIAYCSIVLLTLKVSMVGRLGGINHITRALVLSVLFVVLILPWQEIFGWFTAGALYAPSELTTYIERYDSFEMYEKAFFYLRFVGYWLVVLLLLIFAQIRTARWSKATLRRLEVV